MPIMPLIRTAADNTGSAPQVKFFGSARPQLPVVLAALGEALAEFGEVPPSISGSANHSDSRSRSFRLVRALSKSGAGMYFSLKRYCGE